MICGAFLGALTASAAGAQSAPIPTAPPELSPSSSSDLNVSVPAPLLIETVDGVDPTTDPLVADAIALLIREHEADRARIADTSGTGTSGSHTPAGLSGPNQGSGIQVRYITPPPPDVQAVVDAAAASWNEVLDIATTGPVEVEFDWRILPANILGLAAPTSFEQSTDLPRDDLYPVALANVLLSTDRAPDRGEITIILAANLYGVSNGWFVDPNPNPVVPPDQLDLFTVVVHEIGHGLGFTGSARNQVLGNELIVFDRLARFNGAPLANAADIGAALTSENLFIDIGGERLAALYAPSRYVNRVSYSHFDEQTDAALPGGLMTPAFGTGEENRTIDAATLGVMSQLGWTVRPDVLTPRIRTVDATGGNVTVGFSNQLGRAGLPPIAHRVTVTDEFGVVLSSDVISWQTTTATIATPIGQPNVVVSVEPVGTTGSGSTASVVLRSRPSRVSVTGVGTSRSVRWLGPTAPADTALVYVVERRRISENWQVIATTRNEFMTDEGLTPGVYQYRVAAQSPQSTSLFAVSPITGVDDGITRPMALDGQVARLYGAFFGRSPDSAGMSYWLEQRAQGTSIDAIADAFAASREFQDIAGEPDDGRFIDAIYRSVLSRGADTDGKAFWLDRLQSGTSRGQLVVAFSDSPEFVALTQTHPPTSSVEGAINRLYWAFLQRPPEDTGLRFWAGGVERGEFRLQDVANAFATSVEFTSTYGALSNQEFLDLVYDNVLGRRAEDPGFNYWLGQLESNRDRGSVMLGFANGTEFILQTGTIP